MNIAQFENHAAVVKKLANKGQTHIAALSDEITKHLADHLTIVSTTPHSITVSFYGLRVRFRVEIGWTANETNAQIAAYGLSYDIEPKETLLVAYPFDNMGNVKSTYLSEEFGAPLLAEVFTLLHQAGTIILRP